MRCTWTFGWILLATLVARGEAYASTPKEAFADGNDSLAKGDLNTALQSYAKAARGDRENSEYLQRFMLVRRAIVLRDSLTRERDPGRWGAYAQALRAFYVGEGLYGQTLEIDEQIHARQNTTYSAMQLAETRLALDMNAEAAEVLSALGEKATTASQALLGVARARQGKTDEARQIAESIAPPSESGPGTLYSLARVNAIVGRAEQSLSLLVRCYEATPPSKLDSLKAHAGQAPEFAKLASTAAFAQAQKTASKTAESKCSGGSSCAGCPMRGQCPSSGGR
ncbi:MAG: tetratricopeptide repeat protein [Planctomycetota bacterium]